MTIFVVGHATLHSALALWAAKRYNKDLKDAPVRFVHDVPRHRSLRDDDILVYKCGDEQAQRNELPTGFRRLPSAGNVLRSFAPCTDQAALASLIAFVESAAPLSGASITTNDAVDHIAFIGTALNLRAAFGAKLEYAYERLYEQFDGYLKRKKLKLILHEKADATARIGTGLVAISYRPADCDVHALLFAEYGVRAIAYRDGNVIGVIQGGGKPFNIFPHINRNLISKQDEDSMWKYTEATGHLRYGEPEKQPFRPSTVDLDRLAVMTCKMLEASARQRRSK